jgi:hypothetical protein
MGGQVLSVVRYSTFGNEESVWKYRPNVPGIVPDLSFGERLDEQTSV